MVPLLAPIVRKLPKPRTCHLTLLAVAVALAHIVATYEDAGTDDGPLGKCVLCEMVHHRRSV